MFIVHQTQWLNQQQAKNWKLDALILHRNLSKNLQTIWHSCTKFEQKLPKISIFFYFAPKKECSLFIPRIA